MVKPLIRRNFVESSELPMEERIARQFGFLYGKSQQRPPRASEPATRERDQSDTAPEVRKVLDDNGQNQRML